jgi:hypothetical protein
MVALKRAIAWPKEVLRWLLVEFRLSLFTLLVLFVAFIVLRASASEFTVRLVGLHLQWSGLGTVAVGIWGTRRLFKHPSFIQQLKEKLSRLPRWRRDVTIVVGTAEAKVTLGSAIAHGRGSVGQGASVEEQLKALARSIERIDERLVQIQKENESEWRKHSESLQQERELREKNEKDLCQLIEDAAAGGLNISIAGLIWLFVGLFLSALPSEIAQWMR